MGDILLVQDSNVVRGVWKLAQVMEAKPGRDNIARQVKLRYNLPKAGKCYMRTADKSMYLSVHRLAL